MAKKDYTKLEKDDLLKVIEKLESRKKYGLIWDEEKTKEQFEKESENALPVLKEVKGKEIKTDPSKPTNILIEGDNYHALSVLNYTHQGKIDVIYIDPPYNTGNKDFKYNDRFVDKDDSYRHSKWLSFMSKRLRLAKNLMKEDGVIFISIDDNEYAQLKLTCDEIFGEKQFISNIIWHKKTQPSYLSKEVINVTEYILVYKKGQNIIPFKGGFTDKNKLVEMLNISNGYGKRIFKKEYVVVSNGWNGELKAGEYGNGKLVVKLLKNIKVKNGKSNIDIEIEGRFKWSQERIDEACEMGGVVHFKSIKTLRATLQRNDDIEKIKPPISLFSKYINDIPTNTDATNELKDMFDGVSPMDYPKPRLMIQYLIDAITYDRDRAIVLDFMAGSGTTGHAILNTKSHKQFILCTNNEENICTDICYPRIQKAIKGYKTPKGEKIDGLGGNLKYYKTAFVKNSISRDDLKMRITRECTEMLCLREGIFDEVKAKPDYHIFEQNDRIMGVYYSMERDSLAQLKKELDKMEGEKILYCFTFDPLGLDKNDFADWQGVSLEPIPQKILDIYEQIYEY